MEKKSDTDDDPFDVPDLAEKYGPIGLKAVLSASLFYRKKECIPVKPTGDDGIHLLSRLSSFARPETAEIEVEGSQKRKEV